MERRSKANKDQRKKFSLNKAIFFALDFSKENLNGNIKIMNSGKEVSWLLNFRRFLLSGTEKGNHDIYPTRSKRMYEK